MSDEEVTTIVFEDLLYSTYLLAFSRVRSGASIETGSDLGVDGDVAMALGASHGMEEELHHPAPRFLVLEAIHDLINDTDDSEKCAVVPFIQPSEEKSS